MKIVSGIWLVLAAFAQAAGLEFKELLKEVTATGAASNVVTDFEFTNKTNKPVTIAKSDPGCSCVSVQITGGKLKYAPGESGVIRTTFDMGNYSGTVDKAIAVWLDNDGPNKPSVKLTVRVHIPVLVALEPKTVTWEIGAKPEPRTIQIRMAEGENIQVLGVKSSSETFSTEVKTLEKGKKYDLVVTPLATDGPSLGILRIETDSTISKHKVQQAFAVVRKPTAAETSAKK
jgi:hypothetical protein